MKALTVGGAMIDTIAIIESDRIERMSMLNAEISFLLLEEGRKTEALDISMHCGGGAVNTSIALARLGLDVAAMVKLGRDERAETVVARLMEEGVSTRWVSRDPRAPTGGSVLVSSHERNAAVFTFRGANTLLDPSDLDEDAFAVDLIYISHLSNKSADCFPLIIEKAKAHGALIAVNPGVRQLSARGDPVQECLPQVDILAINRAEADVMVTNFVAQFGEGGPALALEPGEQPPALAARGLASGGFEMSLPKFFGALRQLGTKCTLLTDGLGGAFVCHKDEILFCPARDAEVAGTAGAGDAFAATFAAFLALGEPGEAALKGAAVNAASVVTHVDTQTGLMTREAIEARLGDAPDFPVRKWPL
ncbi:MAG: carbohydrate kinase family protein [Hyphomicrobium sp.]